MEINRRDFVKGLGAGAALALIAGGARSESAYAATGVVAGTHDKAMLYDSERCTGCRACQNACKLVNNRPAESIGYDNLYDNPIDLSAKTWTLIKYSETAATKDLLLCKYQCMHCSDAACVKVCPTGALTRHSLGFVNFDQGKCSGCGYCAEFCPFHIPHLEGSTVTGKQVMQKCTFCADRVNQGKPTGCAEACPAGALIYGDRQALLQEAKNRLTAMKTTYPNANLYGEKELGGLHVLYLLKDKPILYAFPAEPAVPDTAVAWQDIIQPLGWAVGGLTVIGLGLNYLVARGTRKTEKEKEK